MKRIEFKAKYTNSAVEIAIDMYNETLLIPSKPKVREKVRGLCTLCEELSLGFKITDRLIPTFKGDIQVIHIFDPHLQTKDIPSKHQYEEFIADWNSVLEAEQKEKEKQEKEKYKSLELLLKQNGIETESFEEVTNNPEYLKLIKASGYIQSRTNLEISLWWHYDGSRVVFICGRGIFKLSPIKLD